MFAAGSQPALLAISTTAGGYDEQEKEIKEQKMKQRQKNKSIHLVLMKIETEILFFFKASVHVQENCINKLNCKIIYDRN